MCLAQILDVLKYQNKIDHTHIHRWVRVIKDEFACTWSYKPNGGQKEDELLDTDKWLIAYYMALGCLDGEYSYFLVVKSGIKYSFLNMSLNSRCA